MAETWLLNENILFEPTIYYDNHTFPNSSLTSNGQHFDNMSVDDDHAGVWIYYGNTLVRDHIDGWFNQAYRTVIFDNAPTGELLAWLQVNGTKQSASSPTFKHFFNSGTIGSGTIKFRHFSQTEPLPQLATPQNVAINGTTLSWDAVENATSYDIYADGTLIGNTDGGAASSGYTVTITEANVASNYAAYINGVGVARDLSTNIQVFHNVKTFNIECNFTGNRIYNATGSLTNASWDEGFAYSEDIDITEDSSASLDTDQ